MRSNPRCARARRIGRLSATFLGVAAAATSQMIPLGPDFQVNAHTPGFQFDPAVAFTPTGGFVVVWQSETSAGTDTSYSSIQGRRFAADGTPLDPTDFQINTLTTGPQLGPAVAARPDGSFVVAWSSYASAGSDQEYTSIQARRFDAGGDPLDPVEFQVNSEVVGYQDWPDIGVDAAGGFVVAWVTSLGTVRGRRFAADGTPLDPTDLDLRGSAATDDVGNPALAVRPQGEFVVVWRDACIWRDGCYGVWGRRFDAEGSPLDPAPFVANLSQYDFYVGGTDVAVDAEGDFVVVWKGEMYLPGTGIGNIWARRYMWPLWPLDLLPVLVNTPFIAEEELPEIALDSESNSVAVWRANRSAGSDTSSLSVQGRRFHADGTVQDRGGYQLNSYTTSIQFGSAVSIDPHGRVVVAWASYGSDGPDTSSWSVQARRYLGLPFFADGFETGDGSRWSSGTPVVPAGR